MLFKDPGLHPGSPQHPAGPRSEAWAVPEQQPRPVPEGKIEECVSGRGASDAAGGTAAAAAEQPQQRRAAVDSAAADEGAEFVYGQAAESFAFAAEEMDAV